MNPTEPQMPPKGHINNPLSVMSPGEQVICEMKRHPFGLLGVYLGSGLLIFIALLIAALAPHYIPAMTAQAKALLLVGALFFSVFVLIFAYIATIIYYGNQWVVTSDSITQMSQTGLFTKQTSQLSLANLEDVTFEQNNMIQTLIGFGTVKVETAGERSKFSFPFCPKPASCAREIIQAHEAFIQAHPEEGQTVLPGSYAPQQQSGYQPPAATPRQDDNSNDPTGPTDQT